MPDRKKRKWREGAVFLLVLLLTTSLAWAVLSRWKRTAHIYAYDEGLNIREEEQLAQNNPNETVDEETPPEDTVPPEEQDDSNQTDPEMDDPDNREQRQDHNDDPEDSDDGKPSDNTGDDGEKHSGDDGGSGEGPGGDGGPEGSSAPSGDGGPAASPMPPSGTAPAEPAGTAPAPLLKPSDPPPSTAPEDKVASLLCEWPDKDKIRYNGDIPKDTIQVTAVYESGKKVKLSSGVYSIIGLSNDSVGTHSMKIAYGDVLGSLRYTVNNWAQSMTVNWPEKVRMHCYRGEDVKGEIEVTVYMADKTTIDLEDEEYTITGISNEKTGVDQTYKIQYEEFTETGTCRFYDQKVTYIDKYYDGELLLDTVEKDATGSLKTDDEIKDESNEPGAATTRGGHEYTLSSTQIIADGKERKFDSDNSWTITRVFDIQILREYQMMS